MKTLSQKIGYYLRFIFFQLFAHWLLLPIAVANAATTPLFSLTGKTGYPTWGIFSTVLGMMLLLLFDLLWSETKERAEAKEKKEQEKKD